MADLTAERTEQSLDLTQWVDECAALTQPDRIHWCDGSQAEYDALIAGMLADNTLIALNNETYPGCYLYRSDPNDVARTEQLTFICTPTRSEAGVTNNWMSPADAKANVLPLFAGSMRGRTMYVIPYLMGTPSSPFTKAGVEITDSPYVVASMRIMTRMGTVALEQIRATDHFSPGLHSTGDLDPKRRFILHFPQEDLVWSIGSGYGGNALLGKKCLALRLASYMGHNEGWMAEHMLILGLQDPTGDVAYMAAAFPSACGKTNLAMLVSPLADAGWRVWTVGDDIAWMRVGDDGRLWAMNPEAGFFGVAPGTSMKTNPNALIAAHSNTIYTNVALTPDNEPWWEGLTDGPPPAGTIDWLGTAWEQHIEKTPYAHPNSRFTAPASQCPEISSHWEDPEGVPISAIIFGGRRARVAPLVYQSFDWQHGTFVGATMASETTAAATGSVGVVRRDPMAMLPFCGYSMAEYWGHWLEMGKRIPHPPAIFNVNWFRKDEDGKFLWPGFGQNIRVLRWMLERIHGTADATMTAIGYVPTTASLDLDGLDLSTDRVTALLHVDSAEWRDEVIKIATFFDRFGSDLPDQMREEYRALIQRLG